MPETATLAQLQSLIPSNRSLVVCDVDEVILHLVAPFEQLLAERGFELRKKAVRLTGNIFHLESGEEASQQDVWAALDILFAEQATRQNPVDGAVEVLRDLDKSFDIVLLTNLPEKYGDLRRDYLASIDVPYPVVTNSGLKGPALKWLGESWGSEIAFIDDTPQHLESVRNHYREAHLIHFMANVEFRTMIGELNSVLLSTGDWQEAGQAIQTALNGKGDG